MDDYAVHPSYFDIASKQTPATPMEALMVADFGDPVEESALEREARKQHLAPLVDAALDLLTTEERIIVEAYVLGGESLRDLAKQPLRPDGGCYGKTWIARIRDRAFDKMRTHLKEQGLSPATGEMNEQPEGNRN